MYRLVYPGSFDPPTLGHLDIMARALRLCDELRVAVLISGSKQARFSLDQRIDMLKLAVEDLDSAGRIVIEGFSGLLVDYVQACGAQAVVRGVRNTQDFYYENDMAEINRHLSAQHETILLPAKPELAFISSTFIKELDRLGQDYQAWLPVSSYSYTKEAFQHRPVV